MTITAYKPRPTKFTGVIERAGWRLKVYEITCGKPLDRAAFERALPLVDAALPQPPEQRRRDGGRYGVGFVIFHEGATKQYTVLAWWDSDNELLLRVFVREPDIGAGEWRSARGHESICIWDLEVIWFERNAWVEMMLPIGDSCGVHAYLQRVTDAVASSRT